MLTPVILSGGSDTRLWPLSRENQLGRLLALTDRLNKTAQRRGKITATQEI